MNPPYPSDAQAKAEILDAGRKIYQRGLVAANDGNLSVRVGDTALWVTPTGVSKGAMTEDMLVKLSLDGTVLEGTRKPSSETKMHLRIYQENPAVRAVVLTLCSIEPVERVQLQLLGGAGLQYCAIDASIAPDSAWLE